ncbi:MAG: MFS transporter [Clostridia bacterium]|nr:MFS transporter [Clostridia bacterium]
METTRKNKSLYHWLILLSCTLAMGSSIGIMINCSGLYFAPVCDELGLRRGDLSLYSTICSLVGGFFSPVVVKLMDKFRVNLIMASGITLQSIATACLGLSHSVWMFYILGAFIGMGYCLCTTIPLVIIINNWFEKSNGLAMGIVMSASGIFGAIFTNIISTLISTCGWRMSYLIVSAISLAISLPGMIFIIRLTPEEKGLLPYGAKEFPVREIKSTSHKVKVSIFSAALISFILYTLFASCTNSMNSHFPGYATETGAGAAAGALMMTGCMVGNIVSKLIFGVLADKIGPVITGAVWSSVSAAALFILSFGHFESSAVLMVLGLFYGFTYAICPVAMPLIVRKIWGINKYAKVFSVGNMFASVGYAIFLSVIGYIYDFTGTYRIATAACAVCSLMAVVFMFVTLVLGRKEKHNS